MVKSKIVKHSKKAWRVTDFKDVDRFLEEERLEERLGDPFETRTNESLFIIDKEDEIEPEKKSSQHKKEGRRGISPLRCHKILESGTKVRDPLVRRNRVKAKGVRFPKVPLSKPAVGSLKIESAEEARIPYDVWAEGSVLERKPKVLRIQASDLFPNVKRYLLESTCDRVMDQPRHNLYKTSKLPAVEPAEPGQSYNPTFADHQNLLLRAHLIEAAKEEKSRKVIRSVGNMMKDVVSMPTEEHWMMEMSQGLAEDREDLDSGMEGDSNDLSTRDDVKAKTKKWRRKEKQRRMAAIKASESKDKKVKEHDVFRLKSIRKELDAHETHVEFAAVKRKREKELQQYKPISKLGPNKFMPQDIELNLSEEITGTLRNVHTDGDLIIDRFKSLQRRNIIEPRKQQTPKRKYKRKKFDKKSHKMEEKFDKMKK